MTATGTRPSAYARLYDALREVDIRLDLDLIPNPPTGDRRGLDGYSGAVVIIQDPGAGPLAFTASTPEQAARLAITAGPDRARDYGIRAALGHLAAQLALDENTP